jgi:hypothetical protein
MLAFTHTHQVTLVLRLFAGCLSDKVEVACHAFLRHARQVAFQWLRNTKHSLTATIDGDKSTEQQTLICEISSLVRQTFDVDADHVGDALSTSEDVSVFVEAAIALRENEPPNSEAHRMQLLFTRDRRIAHKLQNRLRSLVEQDWSSFDSAIVSVWSNYRPSRTRITSRSSHWISVHTQATPTRAQQYVDFNTLTGTLLVDGMQLGRLPDDVVNNASYIRTFGEVSALFQFIVDRTESVDREFWKSFPRTCQVSNTLLAQLSMAIRCEHNLRVVFQFSDPCKLGFLLSREKSTPYPSSAR